ncbi:MAG: DUF998 domain-containing protein [Bauldia sp.]|nr:DUF998 domain-containing protein [Bauldia sp.]
MNAFEYTLLGAGVLAPLLFAGTVLTGAGIRPGYTHRANAVSELIESGAPHKAGLDIAFLAYNTVLIAFCVGLVLYFDDAPAGIRLGTWFLFGTGVLGLVTWQFPMDPIGRRATFRGIGHLVLAGLMSLGTMAAIASFAVGAGSLDGWTWFAVYSWITFAFVLTTGGFAAVSAIGRWPTMGLLERLTIGGGLQWVLVLAVAVLVAA